MDDHTRIQLADYLQAAEIETHIVVEEENSVRADWWRASCELHNWYTTGSKPNVEDAAAHHVAWEHTACAAVDPDSPADAPLYCRMLPEHSGDHFNGGRNWANDRGPGIGATAGPDAWAAVLWPTHSEYEAEYQRLWDRATQAELARDQANLRAAKLRLALISALKSFTEQRRGFRAEVRSRWVGRAQVQRWQRVFDETAPTEEPQTRPAPQPRSTTRYLCPITGCEWYHDRPDVPDSPWQWKGSIEETVAAVTADQARQVDKAISDHAATHSLVEWFREVRQQQNRADAAEANLSELRVRVGLYVDPETRDAIINEQYEAGNAE